MHGATSRSEGGTLDRRLEHWVAILKTERDLNESCHAHAFLTFIIQDGGMQSRVQGGGMKDPGNGVGVHSLMFFP